MAGNLDKKKKEKTQSVTTADQRYPEQKESSIKVETGTKAKPRSSSAKNSK